MLQASRQIFASGALALLLLAGCGTVQQTYAQGEGRAQRSRAEPASGEPAWDGSPVAQATAAPWSGPAPLLVSFDGIDSYQPEGVALTYHWSFGDGRSSSEESPTHEYQSPGLYHAVLTVIDDLGRSDSDEVEIRVGCTRVSPGSYDFEDVAPGSAGSVVFSITNACPDARRVSGITLSGAPVFSIGRTPTLPLALVPGATAEVEVRFVPDGARERRAAQLRVESDDDYTPLVSGYLSNGAELFKGCRPVTTR